jgi:regulator of protease activity HflC (stomatin/prohibitin superfamily)
MQFKVEFFMLDHQGEFECSLVVHQFGFFVANQFAALVRFEFIMFPSTYVTQDAADTCLSRDGLPLSIAVTFQFQMPEQWLLAAVLKYRSFEKWAALVDSATMSAVFHACSDFNITDYQNERGMIQQRMEDIMRIKLEGEDGSGASGVYAKAISLQLKNVGLPERYSTAVAEKQAANEDIALAINQRSQELTKARTLLLTAKEEARKIKNTAMNDANVTLTQAKLKVEETIFAFETEAETIVSMKAMLNLTVDGVLGLLANNMLATVPTLKVMASEPAKFSQKYQE